MTLTYLFHTFKSKTTKQRLNRFTWIIFGGSQINPLCINNIYSMSTRPYGDKIPNAWRHIWRRILNSFSLNNLYFFTLSMKFTPPAEPSLLSGCFYLMYFIISNILQMHTCIRKPIFNNNKNMLFYSYNSNIFSWAKSE